MLPDHGEHALALALFALTSVIMTWPLVAHLNTAVPGPPGDNLEYVWKMWWFKRALLDFGQSPMFNPDVFYPVGYPLALSETTVVHTVLGIPLTALWGEIAAYNLVSLGSFVLAGLGTYLFLRFVGCGFASAICGGLIYAFCPYRMSHLSAGHLPLLGTGWMPLLLLGIEKVVRAPSWRRGVSVGLCYGMLSLSSWYYAVIGGLLALAYVLVRCRPWKSRLLRWSLIRAMLLAGVVALLVIAPMALPVAQQYARGEASYDYSLAYVDRWSSSPLDYLWPNAMHPVWGSALTNAYYQNINENLLYLGAVALALAAIGLARRWRQEPTRAVLVIGVAALALSFGTSLHIGGAPVYLRVPPAVEYQFSRLMYVLTGRLALNKVDYGSMRRAGEIMLPMPGLLAYLFLPLANAMRVWTRFGVVVVLAVSAFAGLGVDALLDRRTRVERAALSAMIAILLLVDFWVAPAPFGHTRVVAQPVDRWLSQQPKAAIVSYPYEKTWYGWMLYPQRVSGQSIAYGYGTFTPSAFREHAEVLADWPSQQALDRLQALGIRYVLAGAASYGDDWPRVSIAMRDLGLEVVSSFEDEPIYYGDRLLAQVRPSEDVPSTELVSGDKSMYLTDTIYVYSVP